MNEAATYGNQRVAISCMAEFTPHLLDIQKVRNSNEKK